MYAALRVKSILLFYVFTHRRTKSILFGREVRRDKFTRANSEREPVDRMVI